MLYRGVVLFLVAITGSFLVFGVIAFGVVGIAKILVTLILALFLGGIVRAAGGSGRQKTGMSRER